MTKKIIGSGSYGTVYQVKNIAVKKLDNQDNGIVLNEPIIMNICNCPFLNKGTDIRVYPNAVYISQELAEQDLHKYLTDRPVEQRNLIIWTENIFSGLNYLHKNRIVHGDIKSQNILIKRGEVKICDFSLSHFNENADISYLDFSSGENELILSTATHRAPEIWLKKNVNYQIDIWSMGCLIYEMVNREYIFPVSIFEQEKTEIVIEAFKLFFSDKQKYFQKYNIKNNYNVMNDTIFRCLSLNPMDRSPSLNLEKLDILEYIKEKLEIKFGRYRKKKELAEFMAKKLTYEEFNDDPLMIKLETKVLKDVGFSLLEMKKFG